jgi:hypothetical protein
LAGVAGGKSLSFASPKESNQRKGAPDIPEFPKIKRVGWAAKNSPRLVIFNFVFCGCGSNTFAVYPPAALDLRRVCKGKKVKTRVGMTGRFVYLGELRSTRSGSRRLLIVKLVLTFSPSQSRRKLSLPGGSAAKVSEPRLPSKYK